jgi:hypothetical protein
VPGAARSHTRASARLAIVLVALSLLVALNGARLGRHAFVQASKIYTAWPDEPSKAERLVAHLQPWLPDRGTIGYLRQDFSWAEADRMARFFMLQYALVPRVLVYGSAPDLLIVDGPFNASDELTGFGVIVEIDDVRVYGRSRQ